MHLEDLTGPRMRSNFDQMAVHWQKLPGWAQAERYQAAERVQKLGFPTTRHEEWRYTSLRPLLAKNFSFSSGSTPTLTPEMESWLSTRLLADASALVFVDGILSTGLSRIKDLGLEVKSLADAQVSGDDIWWSRLWTDKDFDEVFVQLALMFADQGLHVYVNGEVEKPLHILHISTGQNNRAHAFRHVLHLGPKAKLDVVEEYAAMPDHVTGMTSNGGGLNVSLVQVVADPDSRLRSLHLACNGDRTFAVGNWRAMVASGAQVEHFSAMLSGALNRSHLLANLVGEDANAALSGLYWATGEQVCDHLIHVDHKAPASKSTQMFKGLIGDAAKGVFSGMITVRGDAVGSEAYQTNKNILLSDEAEAYTRPQLLVDTDDVKASHGATVGSLSATEVFYLQSRGISRVDAEQLLSLAFARDVLSHIAHHEMRSLVEARVRELKIGLIKNDNAF